MRAPERRFGPQGEIKKPATPKDQYVVDLNTQEKPAFEVETVIVPENLNTDEQTEERTILLSPINFYFQHEKPEFFVNLHLAEKALKNYFEGRLSIEDLKDDQVELRKDWNEFYTAVKDSLDANPLPLFDELSNMIDPQLTKVFNTLKTQTDLDLASQIYTRLVGFQEKAEQTQAAIEAIQTLEERAA